MPLNAKLKYLLLGKGEGACILYLNLVGTVHGWSRPRLAQSTVDTLYPTPDKQHRV